MKRIIALAFAIAALVLMAPAADARDGCGSGWHFNGRTCVPNGGPYYSPYAAPMYAPPRGYYQDRYYDSGRIRPTLGANGTISCGNPRYTWQDGACRPYRGY